MAYHRLGVLKQHLQWRPIQMRVFHSNENGIYFAPNLPLWHLFFGRRKEASRKLSFEWQILIWIGHYSTLLLTKTIYDFSHCRTASILCCSSLRGFCWAAGVNFHCYWSSDHCDPGRVRQCWLHLHLVKIPRGQWHQILMGSNADGHEVLWWAWRAWRIPELSKHTYGLGKFKRKDAKNNCSLLDEFWE